MELLESVKTYLEDQWIARGDLARRWPHAGSRGLVRRVEAVIDRGWLGKAADARALRGNPEPWFEKLGRLVEDRWAAKGFSVESFASIASAALAEMPPAGNVDPMDVIRWVSREKRMPTQDLGVFADFQAQVYGHERFYIEVLFWVNSTTSVHQHAFAGAFQVLAGSSVHAGWDFDLGEKLAPGLIMGNIRQKDIQYLRPGFTQPILSGDRFIHSLFHLERPSVTVVIRTRTLLEKMPQYAYLTGDGSRAAGMDPMVNRAELKRKLACLSMLVEARPDEALSFLGEAMTSEDAFGAIVLLRTVNAKKPALVEGGLAILKRRFGGLADDLDPMLAGHRAGSYLMSIRSKVVDPELRYFLALLLNAGTRAQVQALVQAKFPERDASVTISDWLDKAAALDPRLRGELSALPRTRAIIAG